MAFGEGLRVPEVDQLKHDDICSKRMLIRIEKQWPQISPSKAMVNPSKADVR